MSVSKLIEKTLTRFDHNDLASLSRYLDKSTIAIPSDTDRRELVTKVTTGLINHLLPPAAVTTTTRLQVGHLKGCTQDSDCPQLPPTSLRNVYTGERESGDSNTPDLGEDDLIPSHCCLNEGPSKGRCRTSEQKCALTGIERERERQPTPIEGVSVRVLNKLTELRRDPLAAPQLIEFYKNVTSALEFLRRRQRPKVLLDRSHLQTVKDADGHYEEYTDLLLMEFDTLQSTTVDLRYTDILENLSSELLYDLKALIRRIESSRDPMALQRLRNVIIHFTVAMFTLPRIVRLLDQDLAAEAKESFKKIIVDPLVDALIKRRVAYDPTRYVLITSMVNDRIADVAKRNDPMDEDEDEDDSW